jgi:phospholipase C
LSGSQAEAAREACTFKAGTLPGLSMAKDAPLGSEIPIDTFVIMMMENRSFDHMLGNLKSMQPDAEVSAPDATNPDLDGTPVQFFHQTQYCLDDPNHGWNEVHLEWDNGKMDGFVINNYQNNGEPADGKRAMGYYTEADIPFFYAMASTFALADHSFCSLLGPTFPNRAYLQAATSFGTLGTPFFQDAHNNLIEIMENAHVTWRDYYSSLPTLGTFLESLSRHIENITRMQYLAADAMSGSLSQVNFVDPELGDSFGADRTDLHPPGDVQLGDQFLEQTIKLLMASPQWPHMAIIVTFDEHGGFYDHVPPPPACRPDDLDPQLNPGDQPGKFDRYGVRVPTIVISPYSKPHYVSHDVFDHTSILRLLEARFLMPAMTARDANANPMLDLFDFSKATFLKPPSLPTPTINQDEFNRCVALYPSPPP